MGIIFRSDEQNWHPHACLNSACLPLLLAGVSATMDCVGETRVDRSLTRLPRLHFVTSLAADIRDWLGNWAEGIGLGNFEILPRGKTEVDQMTNTGRNMRGQQMALHFEAAAAPISMSKFGQ